MLDALVIGAIAIVSTRYWLNSHLPAGDFSGFYVWSWYLKTSLAQYHTMPDWSPYWLGGATFYELFPFLGLWVVLPAVAAGSILGTKLIAILLVVFSGFSMYWLAYYLTRSRNGALLAGIAYVVFPYHVLITAVYFHLDQMMAFAWVPVVLVLLFKAVESRRRVPIVLAGISLGVLPLMNLEYVVTLFPLAVILGAFLTMSPYLDQGRPGLLRQVGQNAIALAAIGGIAVATSAWWSFPSFAHKGTHFLLPGEYARPVFLAQPTMLVDRGGGNWGRVMPDWVVNSATGAVHPAVAMYNGAFYLGVVLLALWSVGSVNILFDRSVDGRSRRYFVLFSAVLVAGTYLALGTNWRVLSTVYPLADSIRSPFRFLFLSALALPVLAAFFCKWAESKLATRSGLPKFASGGLTAILVLFVLMDFYPYQDFYRYSYKDSFMRDLKRAYDFAGKQPGDYRIANPKDRDPVYNMGVIYSGKPILGAWVWWTSTVEFGDLYIRRLSSGIDTMASAGEMAASLGQANVLYLVLDTPPPRSLSEAFTPAYAVGSFTVWEDSQWRPFVETSPASSPSWERRRPGEIVLDVQLDADGLVTVRESFSPFWRAYVDGRPVSPTVGDEAFLSVAVPRGQHRVLLKFEQGAAPLVGRAVTLLLVAVLLGLLVVGIIRRPRNTEGGFRFATPTLLDRTPNPEA